MSQEFYETDSSRGFVRGYSFEMLRGIGPRLDGALGHGRGPPAVGRRTTTRAYRRRCSTHRAACSRSARTCPSSTTASRSIPVLTDSQRHPGAEDRLPAQREQRGACWSTAWRAAQEVLRGGRRRVDVGVESPLRVAGWHLMGTARMGTDPERSVVNEWGRCHDVKQPLHRRRQHLRDGRRREPDLHDPGARALHRRHDQEEPRQPLRLSEDSAMPDALSADQTAALAGVLDLLIPPSARRPHAGRGRAGVAARIDATRGARRGASPPASRPGLAALDDEARGARRIRLRRARAARSTRRAAGDRARAARLRAEPDLPHLRRLLPGRPRARRRSASKRARRFRRATRWSPSTSRCSRV